MRRLVPLLLLPLCAATCPTDPPASLEGTWGGEHIGIVVDPSLSSTAALVEFDCATGRIDWPFTLGADGRFDATGVYIQGHGGPVREGDPQPQDVHPARYSGTVRGEVMSLDVMRLDDPTAHAPQHYTLRKGANPHVFKCL